MMGKNLKIRLEDLAFINTCDFIDWKQFNNTSVLITGASGLIGSSVANALLYIAEKRDLNIKIIAWVRDVERARAKIMGNDNITYLEAPVEKTIKVPCDISYIIHAANPTKSRFFVTNPVETIETAVLGTRNVLNLAKEKNCKGFVYLSSMEVYGYPGKGRKVKEGDVGAFDTSVVRNSYPLSKILCESMVTAYASEYSVPAKMIRLTQTFGPGVEYQDPRVFAEFARCAIENRNIVLHSDGKTERCYLYIADAVTAVLSVLLYGKPGEAYTAANSKTYCSISDMARLVAHDAADGKISVTYDLDGIDRGYADTLYMDLNTDKLESLGWHPEKSLKEMFVRMIEDMK